ncbi:hypothetical protein [Comamonas antarctica]|uniref:hypothetical protein n=1 Tax=Comamonas antarctica TaxID=2743470 RepID=UPI0028E47A90|nr:hypothetical protein [Comamonas antarctica]
MTAATQAEALRLAQECADYATSLRSTIMVAKLEGKPEPVSMVRAAGLFERAAARIAELEASRFAYANEFEPNADGDPDVGSIHANIRALKAQAQPAREPLTDEQIQDLIGFGDPTEQECYLVRLGWEAAGGTTKEKQG